MIQFWWPWFLKKKLFYSLSYIRDCCFGFCFFDVKHPKVSFTWHQDNFENSDFEKKVNYLYCHNCQTEVNACIPCVRLVLFKCIVMPRQDTDLLYVLMLMDQHGNSKVLSKCQNDIAGYIRFLYVLLHEKKSYCRQTTFSFLMQAILRSFIFINSICFT